MRLRSLLDNKAVSSPDCKARHRASPAIQEIGLTRMPACAAPWVRRSAPDPPHADADADAATLLTIARLLRGPTSLL